MPEMVLDVGRQPTRGFMFYVLCFMFCGLVCLLWFVTFSRTNTEREVPLYFVFCGVVARVLGVDVASHRLRAQTSTSEGRGEKQP